MKEELKKNKTIETTPLGVLSATTFIYLLQIAYLAFIRVFIHNDPIELSKISEDSFILDNYFDFLMAVMLVNGVGALFSLFEKIWRRKKRDEGTMLIPAVLLFFGLFMFLVSAMISYYPGWIESGKYT